MYKKKSLLNKESEILNGVIILLIIFAIGALNFRVFFDTFSFSQTSLMFVLQIIAIFVLAIILEELYFNSEKIHISILIITIPVIALSYLAFIDELTVIALFLFLFFLLGRVHGQIKSKSKTK